MRSWPSRAADQQSAVDHPLRAELLQATDGFQPAAIGFIDMAALAPLTPDAVDLGLDGLERIDLQWGFQDAALVTRLRVAAPVPRRGVLALLDQPTFSVNTLPPLPANLTSLFVLSVDLAKTYDQVDSLDETGRSSVAHGPPERRHPRSSWDRPPQGASRAPRSPDRVLRAGASRRRNGNRGLAC